MRKAYRLYYVTGLLQITLAIIQFSNEKRGWAFTSLALAITFIALGSVFSEDEKKKANKEMKSQEKE